MLYWARYIISAQLCFIILYYIIFRYVFVVLCYVIIHTLELESVPWNIKRKGLVGLPELLGITNPLWTIRLELDDPLH